MDIQSADNADDALFESYATEEGSLKASREPRVFGKQEEAGFDRGSRDGALFNPA